MMLRCPPFVRDDLSLLLRAYGGQGRTLALYALGAVAMSAMVVPNLVLMRFAFDRAIPEHELDMLAAIGLALVLLRAITSLLAIALRRRIVGCVRGATARLRQELVAALQLRAHAAAAERDSARLHSQIVFDTERVDNMADALLSGALPALIAGTLLFGALLWLNAGLVALAAVFLPPMWLAGRWTGRRMRGGIRAFQAAFEEFGRGTRFLLDHLDMTRALAAEGWERARQASLTEALRVAAERMARDNAYHSHLQANVIGLPGVALLVAGGAAVVHGTLSMGEFLVFYIASNQLNTQVERLGAAVPATLAGIQSLASIRQLAEVDPPEPWQGTTPINFGGDLVLRDVGFAYRGGTDAVLRNVNLHIRPGETLALVGPNGSGKTTLIHLIMGFIRPDTGTLEADGVPYGGIAIRSLRRGIGLVPQHPLLFAGTVYENVAYGRPEATRADVSAAIERASAGALLRRLPAGLDSPVGEGGNALSGGERQLLALARAQLGGQRLLIMDEPTNHLDRATVIRLMDGLARQPDKPAILVVSHDPAVVAHAGRVLRIEGGRLFEVTAAHIPVALP